MNVVHLVGNLGADPELRVTAGGLSILNLRLATSERVKKGEEWVEHTEWHRITVFGKRADGLSKFLAKGSKVAVTGKLRTTSYEKDGIKKYSTDIIADDVEPCDRKGGGGQKTGGGEPGDAGDDFGGSQAGDDDIPF